MASQLSQPINTVEDYVRANPNADPKALLDVVMAQTEMLREEYRGLSEVQMDENMQFKPRNLAGLWRLGTLYAQSEMVPKHYRNRVADCTIAVQMALRCGVEILTFLQSSYIVHGTPGLKSTLAIAMINASGKIKGRIGYRLEGEGTSRQCTAYAKDVLTGEVIEATLEWSTVEAEGWNKDKKNSETGYTQKSKWNTMPDQMFKYRSAMFLARANFPDVLMGMYTDDELEDVHGQPISALSAGRTQQPSIQTGAGGAITLDTLMGTGQAVFQGSGQAAGQAQVQKPANGQQVVQPASQEPGLESAGQEAAQEAQDASGQQEASQDAGADEAAQEGTAGDDAGDNASQDAGQDANADAASQDPVGLEYELDNWKADIQKATTAGRLDQLADEALQASHQNRKAVMDAIANRRAELKAPKGTKSGGKQQASLPGAG
jgi:hypothetical protein